MKPIRQIIKVVNHRIEIILPEDFNFDEVEVSILPTKKIEYIMNKIEINQVNESAVVYESLKFDTSQDFIIPEWQKQEVLRRTEEYYKNPSSAEVIEDIDDFFSW